MDFIKTPAKTVTPDNESIIQAVTVYMDNRAAPPVVHLTQYDKELPVLAVRAKAHGEAYAFPDGAAVNIRMGGKVYAPVLGLSEDRQTAYVSVAEDMTETAGESTGVLEVVLDGGVAASAPITFQVDKSPAENVKTLSTPAVIADPPSTSIIQTVSVYIDGRSDVPVVHLTQYDQTIPVIAVNVFYNDQPYTFPAGAAVNVRMAKPDGKHVYDPALGISSDRLTAYIAVTAQMTAAYGKGRATLEVVLNGGIAGTAPIGFFIDKNPVPADAYESTDEYKSLYDLVQDAEAAAAAAKASETATAQSQKAAADSEAAAKDSADKAAELKDEAEKSKVATAESAAEAKKSEAASKESEIAADKYAKASQSYAVGGTGTRENEEVDNARYYYDQAKRISQGLSGALLPMGTITFAELATQTKQAGYMYNISDAFTTDATFKEGAGHAYPAGTNVYYTADEYWDCLAGTQVVSVNGQTGAVEITAKSIGAVSSVNGTAGDVELGTRNYWIVAQNSCAGITYDSATGIYSASDGDTAATLALKILQLDGNSAMIPGSQKALTVNGPGLYTFSDDIKAGCKKIRFANSGKITEFSVIQPIPFAEGTPFVLSLTVLDTTVGKCKIRDIALFRGNAGADWIPAPEDIPGMAPVQSVNGGSGDVEIGGRNLLPGTKDFTHQYRLNGDLDSEKYLGFTVAHANAKQTSGYIDLYWSDDIPRRKYGEDLTLSFWVKGSGVVNPIHYSVVGDVRAAFAESSKGNTINSGNIQIPITDSWERVWAHFRMGTDGDLSVPRPFIIRCIQGSEIYICGVKAEFGTRPTDWTPAPEDKQDVPVAFSVSLPVASWANNSQTVKDARFLDGNQYVYDVDVRGLCVPWDGVSITAGQMVVKVDIVPTADVTVDVVREEVQNG